MRCRWGRPASRCAPQDLAACGQPLAAVIHELPIRESGGRLPSWDELQALKDLARQRGVRLHLDGARLWESTAGFERTAAEIAAGFDSVYVSFYKGIGCAHRRHAAGGCRLHRPGAAVAPPHGRHAVPPEPDGGVGGDAVRRAPGVDAGAAAARPHAGRGADTGARAACRPRPAAREHDAPVVRCRRRRGADARDTVAAESGCWLFGGVREADAPGWSRAELYVGDALLDLSDEQVLPLFRQLTALMARA
jgi:hypothetical protein